MKSEGKLHLVREELCNGATGGPVVWQGNAGQLRTKGLKLKASKLETSPKKRPLRTLVKDEFDRVGVYAPR